MVDAGALASALRAALQATERITVTAADPAAPWWSTAAEVHTRNPAAALAALVAHAHAVACRVNTGVADLDPLAFALRRLADEVRDERSG